MAIQCKYCGTNLPKDDARFCNNCGMLVPSHPFSPQSLAALKNDAKIPFLTSSDEPQEGHKSVLREQVAEFAPVRSTPDYPKQELSADKAQARESNNATPEAPTGTQPAQDVEVLEKDPQKVPETPPPYAQNGSAASSANAVSKPRSSTVTPRPMGGRGQASQSRQVPPRPPARLTPVPAPVPKETSTFEKQRSDELDAISPTPFSPDDMSVSKLHVKVWRPEDMSVQAASNASSIEDMPTRAMEVPVEDVPTQTVNKDIEDMPTHAMEVPAEDVPTRSISVVPSTNRALAPENPAEELPKPFSSVPSTQSAAQETLTDDWRIRANSALRSATSFVPEPVRVNTSPFISSPEYQPGDGLLESEAVSPSLPEKRSRRGGLILVVVLLLMVLILGGLGAAIVLSQHGSTDSITQPQVSFSDPHLGLSLQYPNGWTSQVDTTKSTLHLTAIGHVGQIDIVVSANNSDIKQALQQQVTKMGLSGTKAATSLNFAGATWQQLQGTLQQSGTSYTDTIAATLHGGQLYIMVQQAPQNNYADWEKEFFQPLRDSFKFL